MTLLGSRNNLKAYAEKLGAVGYSKVTYSTQLSQAHHFAEWALQIRVPIHGINEATIDQFARHECQCGEMTKHGNRVLASHYRNRQRGGRAFVRHLIDEGLLPPEEPEDADVRDRATLSERSGQMAG